MTREYVIYGETLVKVKGGGFSGLSELGMTSEPIRILPRFVHQDISVDDFGGQIPAEVLWMLGDCRIRMTLVHYDEEVLGGCVRMAMGGGGILTAFPNDGRVAAAGTPMGSARLNGFIGNRFLSLNIASSIGQPWRFPQAYIDGQPVEIPIGTEKSLVMVTWRAIPYVIPSYVYGRGYVGEIVSSDAVLWDHEADV